MKRSFQVNYVCQNPKSVPKTKSIRKIFEIFFRSQLNFFFEFKIVTLNYLKVFPNQKYPSKILNRIKI